MYCCCVPEANGMGPTLPPFLQRQANHPKSMELDDNYLPPDLPGWRCQSQRSKYSLIFCPQLVNYFVYLQSYGTVSPMTQPRSNLGNAGAPQRLGRPKRHPMQRKMPKIGKRAENTNQPQLKSRRSVSRISPFLSSLLGPRL